jgi:hypothetical protein
MKIVPASHSIGGWARRDSWPVWTLWRREISWPLLESNDNSLTAQARSPSLQGLRYLRAILDILLHYQRSWCRDIYEVGRIISTSLAIRNVIDFPHSLQIGVQFPFPLTAVSSLHPTQTAETSQVVSTTHCNYSHKANWNFKDVLSGASFFRDTFPQYNEKF